MPVFDLEPMKKNIISIILISVLAACSPSAPEPSVTPTLSPVPTIPSATNTNTPAPAVLWISPAVPPSLKLAMQDSGIPVVGESGQATLQFDITQSRDSQSSWIYALVAPFPTLTDNVTKTDLRGFWSGSSSGPFSGGPLLMAESTLRAFTALWGEPAYGSVKIVPEDDLLDASWESMPSWAIIPFESIQPRWKVLTIDRQSPIRKQFDARKYPLRVDFAFTGNTDFALTVPASNYDPSKLTTVILTGVTALWRGTAYTMEVKGITYPGSSIRDVLREADITHISNEVPFDKNCPYPNPGETSLSILCSRPEYMELFTDLGMDVVELSGDHFDNRGVKAMFATIDLYKQNGILYYGGGVNDVEAKKPLLIEKNGNKLAFIGCNAKLDYPHATATIPGAAPCDFKYMTEQIRTLRAQGYLPIVTFQHYEYYTPEARPGQTQDFHLMAAAGAVIVSGSQAHFPQMMEFYNGAFLHYGLGNLFYDQMVYPLGDGTYTDRTRDEFMDRHVFYDGRYLGVEVLTAILMDYSRPQWMTEEQRQAFLSDYFYASGWIPLQPTPIPVPTVTLTPLVLPQPVNVTPTP
jgi:hypothetical protein